MKQNKLSINFHATVVYIFLVTILHKKRKGLYLVLHHLVDLDERCKVYQNDHISKLKELS
jgi:hypothetical protein